MQNHFNSTHYTRTLALVFALLGLNFASIAIAQEPSSTRGAKPQEANLLPTAVAQAPVAPPARNSFAASSLAINPYVVNPSVAPSPAMDPVQDVEALRKRMEKAARSGNSSAELNLGVMYAAGWGVPRNYGAALYWLQSAAKQRNTIAITNLGILYLNGWGVRQDYLEARRYFQSAAEAGDPVAMDNLGYIYDHGLGSAQDQAAAANWYRRAADHDDPLGQNNLADLYLRGEGVPQSDSIAFTFFKESALQGNTAAQIKLGYMYLNGRGTPADAESAYVWLKRAALKGDARGDEYLRWLETHLAKEQLARASSRADESQ